MSVLICTMTTVDPKAPEALATYLGMTGPLMDAVGARILESYEVTETLIGPEPPRQVTIVEYPDRASVDRVYNSAEYLWLSEMRKRAFRDYRISIIRG
ncbi:MAG: DUF1330 domain-containing protein [Rhodobacteraceae bacterium]|nr:DUF1330 domain-containing protein [Paracoccaceae bacterium]